MTIRHIELAAANDFVEQNHRHHKRCAGHRFSIACYDGERLCGVAIIGRPVARCIDQSYTVEVLRLCTDGTKNDCSFLYGAARRCAKALGYSRIITYILCNEPGTSLLASGWRRDKITDGGSWNCPSRPRTDNSPVCRKTRYSIEL